MRRDQTPPRCFRSSGLPVPLNGVRQTSSVNRRMRVAFRGSVSTQNLRSSSASTAKTKLRAEFSDIGKALVAASASVQRPQNAASIGGRAEKVCGLFQGGEIAFRDDDYRLTLFALDAKRLVVRADRVKLFLQIGAKRRIGGGSRHRLHVQLSCTEWQARASDP